MLEELRAATRDLHRRIEAVVGLGEAFGLPEYVRFLARQLGFVPPLEARLEPAWRALGLDGSARRKGARLAADLAALGIDAGALPRCPDLPDVAALPRALGCVYVLEGQTLGGQVLARRVADRLGLDASRGASFLAAYGGDVRERWREVVGALEAHARCAPLDVPGAVAGAVDTFTLMHRWLERP